MDENGKLDNEISVISSEVQYALCKGISRKRINEIIRTDRQEVLQRQIHVSVKETCERGVACRVRDIFPLDVG